MQHVQVNGARNTENMRNKKCSVYCFNQSWQRKRTSDDDVGGRREKKLVQKITEQNISNNKLLDNGGSHRLWIIHYSFIFLASFLVHTKLRRSFDRFIKRSLCWSRWRKKIKAVQAKRRRKKTRNHFINFDVQSES